MELRATTRAVRAAGPLARSWPRYLTAAQKKQIRKKAVFGPPTLIVEILSLFPGIVVDVSALFSDLPTYEEGSEE